MHETTPDLLAVARSGGLEVLLAPLMVLKSAALVPDLPLPGAGIRFLDPASPAFGADLNASRAVGRLGFGAPANATAVQAGSLVVEVAGPEERDAVPPLGDDDLAQLTRRHASGRLVSAVVESPAEGILTCGSALCADAVAEIAGVATLPSARRRGYASQLTASLARRALHDGADLILLSAGDDDTARLYSKVGFRRIGTACIAEPAPA